MMIVKMINILRIDRSKENASNNGGICQMYGSLRHTHDGLCHESYGSILGDFGIVVDDLCEKLVKYRTTKSTIQLLAEGIL